MYLASFPGTAQLSVACSTEKQGEPGIFSQVNGVTTNEKLMNVGRLKHNGVIAQFPRRWSECVCFLPSNRALRLPCKVYVFRVANVKNQPPNFKQLTPCA